MFDVPALADRAALSGVRAFLAPALALDVHADGTVPAAARIVEGNDPTHYDAVWVRDAVWVSLGLDALDRPQEAVQVLRRLIRYYATPAQRARLHALIANPSLYNGADGAMNVLHIRYDGRSPQQDDVQVNGAPQRWNHKQNDALGLFYASVLQALTNGRLQWESLTADEQEPLLRLPCYFAAIHFAEREDAGAWEEIERRNSSSIGLVTWALEEARRWTQTVQGSRALAAAEGQRLVLADGARLDALIASGYRTLEAQLPFESPAYPPTDPRYREADAALLALVYPAQLEWLATDKLAEIVQTVQRLERERGVLRYENDSYQCAGYWTAADEASSDHDSRTDDFSGEDAFVARARGLATGTEAQWFFDSWLSQACGRLYAATGETTWRDEQLRHLRRAIAQLTTHEPGSPPPLGADRKPVPAFALPESYNVHVGSDGTRSFLPSPVTPLNWAKASLALALRAMDSSFAL